LTDSYVVNQTIDDALLSSLYYICIVPFTTHGSYVDAPTEISHNVTYIYCK